MGAQALWEPNDCPPSGTCECGIDLNWPGFSPVQLEAHRHHCNPSLTAMPAPSPKDTFSQLERPCPPGPMSNRAAHAPIAVLVGAFGLAWVASLGAGCGPGLEPPAKGNAAPTAGPNADQTAGQGATGGAQDSPHHSGGSDGVLDAFQPADAGSQGPPFRDNSGGHLDGGSPLDSGTGQGGEPDASQGVMLDGSQPPSDTAEPPEAEDSMAPAFNTLRTDAGTVRD